MEQPKADRHYWHTENLSDGILKVCDGTLMRRVLSLVIDTFVAFGIGLDTLTAAKKRRHLLDRQVLDCLFLTVQTFKAITQSDQEDFIESKTLDKTASCLLYFELSVDRQEVWKERKA